MRHRYDAVLRFLAGFLTLAFLACVHAQPLLVDFEVPVPQGFVAAPGATSDPYSQPTLAALQGDPNVLDLRVGRAAPEAIIQAGAFRFDPTAGRPGDTLLVDALEVAPAASGVRFLRADGVALVVEDADLLGTVRADGQVWRFRPLGSGWTAVFRYDRSNLRQHPPGWSPRTLSDELSGLAPSAATPDPAPQAGLATVDILVGWTPAAAVRVGSNPRLFAEAAVASANRHFGFSRLADVVRLRLVHAGPVSFVESGDLVEDLVAFAGRTDGRADSIHALRDRHGADLIHLLIDGVQPDSGGRIICGAGGFAHRNAAAAFALTAVQCEDSSRSTFTHEVGHNFGADHDVANFRPPSFFDYGRGWCDPAGWGTVMSYIGINNSCTRGIPYFSSPDVTYSGRPTGRAGSADNRRVLQETAHVVAAHRPAVEPVAHERTLPWVLGDAGPGTTHSLVRLANPGNAALALTIRGYDDAGTEAGPVTVRLAAKAAVQITSERLEKGTHPALTGSLGDGTGAWLLELSAPQPFEAQALLRTTDQFMGPVHAVAPVDPGSAADPVYRIPTANPASNRTKVSMLRIASRSGAAAQVRITAFDDRGDSYGPVSFRLPARNAVVLTMRELEAGRADPGGPALSAPLGDGEGKWRILVSSDQPLAVASLLELTTGTGKYFVNLSGLAPALPPASDTSDPPSPPSPPPPQAPADLVVAAVSISDPTLHHGQSFTMSATVSNAGGTSSSATRVVYYVSTDASISPAGDVAIGADSIPGLAADESSTQSFAYNAPPGDVSGYYGACVASVTGEADTGNNCSAGRPVRVSGPDPNPLFSFCNLDPSTWGALAAGWRGTTCQAGFGAGAVFGQSSASVAMSLAETACRRLGLRNCEWNVAFQRCGALAFGRNATGCGISGGFGDTRALAQGTALRECRERFSDCRIPRYVSADRRPAASVESLAGPLERGSTLSGYADGLPAFSPYAVPEAPSPQLQQPQASW